MNEDVVYVGRFGPAGETTSITVTRRHDDGRLEPIGEVPTAAPSFLAAHPLLPRLYAVNSLDEGTMTTFDIRADGDLLPLTVRTTDGALPCHVAVAPGGGQLAVANYTDGRVACYRLDESGVPTAPAQVLRHVGRGPNRKRQEGSHAHFASFHRGALFAVDLGTDQVHRYLAAADGTWSPRPDGPARMSAGSGPRHLVTDGHGAWVVACELDGTVRSYIDGADGRWGEVSRLPASASRDGNQPSHIEISADGQFVYVANRGPDTITVFHLERAHLSLVGEVATGGAWPRHFAFAGDFLYVANERSDDVTVFTVGLALPQPTGHKLRTSGPTCVLPVRLT